MDHPDDTMFLVYVTLLDPTGEEQGVKDLKVQVGLEIFHWTGEIDNQL